MVEAAAVMVHCSLEILIYIYIYIYMYKYIYIYIYVYMGLSFHKDFLSLNYNFESGRGL